MNSIVIAPSILSLDYANVSAQLEILEKNLKQSGYTLM